MSSLHLHLPLIYCDAYFTQTLPLLSQLLGSLVSSFPGQVHLYYCGANICLPSSLGGRKGEGAADATTRSYCWASAVLIRLSSALLVMDLNFLYGHFAWCDVIINEYKTRPWELRSQNPIRPINPGVTYAVCGRIIITCKFILVLPEHSLEWVHPELECYRRYRKIIFTFCIFCFCRSKHVLQGL